MDYFRAVFISRYEGKFLVQRVEGVDIFLNGRAIFIARPPEADFVLRLKSLIRQGPGGGGQGRHTCQQTGGPSMVQTQ